MKRSCLRHLLCALVLSAAVAVSPAQALTTCQTSCNSQYYTSVNALWQTPRPGTTSMPDYRQQVLAALNTLNSCLAACPPDPVNVALGKTASASLSQSGYEPAKAVDGSTSTYWWAKSTAGHWLHVDLGTARTLSTVTLGWNGASYATAYSVQVSGDGISWNTVFSTTVGKGGAVEHSFPDISARYLRVNCTKASGKNGYAVTELGIIGY